MGKGHPPQARCYLSIVRLLCVRFGEFLFLIISISSSVFVIPAQAGIRTPIFIRRRRNKIMNKRVVILGSTGSIGKNALRVIEALNLSLKNKGRVTDDGGQRTGDASADYQIVALSAHNNVELLAEQVHKFKPKYAAITNPQNYDRLKELVGNADTKILTGPESLIEIAQIDEADIVLAAGVGAAGLKAVLAAAKKGRRLAIAAKEPLVIAGRLVMETAAANGADILPIDSEHSAIFQAMQAGKPDEVSKIILTTSGGPFRNAKKEDLRNVTVEQALAHPVWNMGPKITIDSATMMNKALEVIEARWLFDMPADKIEVLVHPESIIHSLVEFVDGSCIAQMSLPDMCLPIQYALTWPRRLPGITSRLRLDQVAKFTFARPDLDTFKGLRLGFDVARVGGTAAAVFNAANEAAVELFLAGRIKFLDIIELVELCLNKHSCLNSAGLDELLEADKWARRLVVESAARRGAGR
jgi:1-deoxy-D-xylulose-5-phosphate reductoisomerase